MDKLRKDIIQCFKDEKLKITIEINLSKTDFLDVFLDLESNKYYPYKKPNDTPVYVHCGSNHPPSVLKQIPKMTSQRLSKLSCNETEFKKVASQYQDVLKQSGFKDKLEYIPEQIQTGRRKRKRKIIWYNPPFDLQVKTNVAQNFLQLVDKHFPRHHKLHKILNRNTVKVSYSCMPNVASQISSHNKSLLAETETSRSLCNCNDKPSCPLDGKCQTEAIIYKGVINTDGEGSYTYVGLSEPPFRLRASDHTCSFNNKHQKTKTDLSKKVWELKAKDIVPTVTFSIVRKSSPYRVGSDHCNLCLWEKFHIMKEGNLINTKNELVSKCRHINKFLLHNYKPPPGRNKR